MIGVTFAPDAASPLEGSKATAVAFRTSGQLHLTIITKATFSFAPDTRMPRTTPQEILRADVHHGKNPGRSARFTSDCAPHLPRVDVLFTGSAFALAERPARSLPVRLAVFAENRALLDKRLLVSDPNGFSEMPIVYERTVRGPDDKENPFGLAKADGPPNIQDPARPEHPAGFGPIGSAWPARKRLLGPSPPKTLTGPMPEIPAEFDWTYFQAAPPDQRIDALRGDEWILLEGLHPSLPRLRTRLPGARGRARIHGLSAFGVSEGAPLDLAADTLRIDGDALTCTVVWRRSLPIAGEAALAAARIVAGVEVDGEAISWPTPAAFPEARPALPALSPAAPLPLGTLNLSSDEGESAARRPDLPFVMEPARLGGPAPSLSGRRAAPGVLLDLLWFDARSLPRIRKKPAWREILERLADEAPDPDIDDPDLEIDPAAAEERREAFEVLAKGEAIGETALGRALEGAVRADGRFVAPIVLLEGELSFPFDEIEALDAVLAAVGPLAGGDGGLHAALAAGRAFLSARAPSSSRSAAALHTAAIIGAYEKGNRAPSFAQVEAQVEEALLEGRRYQRRLVLGGPMIRGLFRPAGGLEEIPAYLPDALSDVLPMFPRLAVRILAEAQKAVDHREKQAVALRVVALARACAAG